MKIKLEAGRSNLTYVCDNCKHKFKVKDIKLIKKLNNISMLMMVMFVNKDGVPGECVYDKLKKSDRLLACPKCMKVHLNGFDVKNIK